MSVRHPSPPFPIDIIIPPSDFSHDLCKQISRAYFFVMSAVNMETCARICNQCWFIRGHSKLISPLHDCYTISRRDYTWDEREWRRTRSGQVMHRNFSENVWWSSGVILISSWGELDFCLRLDWLHRSYDCLHGFRCTVSSTLRCPVLAPLLRTVWYTLMEQIAKERHC